MPFPIPITALKLNVSTGSSPNVQTFEQTIPSATLGTNTVQVTNTNLIHEFDSQPLGTTFSPSIAASYSNNPVGNAISTVTPAPYVPRQITTNLSFQNIPDLNALSAPISLNVVTNSPVASAPLTFSSSNTNVLTVSSSGVVTAQHSGTATITVTQPISSDYVYTAATFVSRVVTVIKETPVLSNFMVPPKNFGSSQFNLDPPTSNSGGSFSYTISSSDKSVADISGNMVIVKNVGDCTITATQAATTTYVSATKDAVFSVLPIAPTFGNFTIAPKDFNSPDFKIDPPISSNKESPLYYTSSDPKVATVSGDMVTIKNVGFSIITAKQNASRNYLYGEKTVTLNVLPIAPTFGSFTITDKKYRGNDFELNPPSSNSDGSFSYSSSNNNVADVSGNMVIIKNAGPCTITAIQDASGNYTVGQKPVTFQVLPIEPNTTFTNYEKDYASGTFTLNPTSESDGSFSYSITSDSATDVATLSGNTVTINNAGSCTITATQDASGNYTTKQTSTTFQVNPIDPEFSTTFRISNVIYGSSDFKLDPPRSNSGGSFSYSIIGGDTDVATISGDMVTVKNVGDCTIEATQASTRNYKTKKTSTTFRVNQIAPTFGAFTFSNVKYDDPDFEINPPPSSTNTVSPLYYSSSNPTVADISGNMVIINNAGDCDIFVKQNASRNYLYGEKSAPLKVLPIPPTFGAFTISDKKYRGPNFELTPPSSSNTGGSFSYISLNPTIADVSGNMVTIKNAGPCTIRVTETAYGNYIVGQKDATFHVLPIEPQTTFNNYEKDYASGTFTLNPTSESDGSFSYSITSDSPTDVATLSGNTVTINNVGSCTITATQDASGNYTTKQIEATLKVNPIDPEFSTTFTISNVIYGSSDFKLDPPRSNSGGSFSYSIIGGDTDVATISGDMVTVKNVGDCTIEATQASTRNYKTKKTSTTFRVNQIAPTFGAFTFSNVKYDDPDFEINPPPSSTNTVSPLYYSSSNPTVADISGNMVIINNAGDCDIFVKQNASRNYLYGEKRASLKVLPIAPQTTFTNYEKDYASGTFTLNPTSESDGSFSYSISSDSATDVATVSGNTVTINNVGSCKIIATQDASGNYTTKQTLATLQVNPIAPEFSTTFTISNVDYGSSDFKLYPPTSNSGGSFSYSSLNTNIADISGNDMVTIKNAGDCTIEATQAATRNYTIKKTTKTFHVNAIAPTYGSFRISDVSYGSSDFNLDPPTSSNKDTPFKYESSDINIATLSGNTVSIKKAGDCIIYAKQDASGNYIAGQTDATLHVKAIAPTLGTFNVPPTKNFGEESFQLTQPTSNSDGSFSYSITSGTEVADVSGNMVTIKKVGDCTITATQDASGNYTIKTITATFHVNAISPILGTFTVPSIKNVGDPNFNLDPPSSNSDGSFSYSSNNVNVATVSGRTVSIIGEGTCKITATQDASGNYTSAFKDADLDVRQPRPNLTWSDITKSISTGAFPITGDLAPSSNSIVSYGSIWNQLGADINGTAPSNQNGGSVSLSADGTIVAIGSTDRVKVYQRDSNGPAGWIQHGDDIVFETIDNDNVGKVSLSADGTVVAIGVMNNSEYRGYVRVYKRDPNKNTANSNGPAGWNKLGADIDGEAVGDQNGGNVSLSADGTILAIGAIYNDGNGNNSGHVRVYKFGSANVWTQLGADIDGEAAADFSGWSVSLSADGTTVAIGALYNAGNGSNSGHVRVFKYDPNKTTAVADQTSQNYNGPVGWTRLGADINGEAANNYSGISVSLSADGTTVAIGAFGNTSYKGQVRVYKYDENKAEQLNQDLPNFGPAGWTRLGADIDGETEGDYSGNSVSLSADGTIVAIGASSNSGNKGHVRVYKRDPNKTTAVTDQTSPNFGPKGWRRLGADIDGKAAGEFSGQSVSLSADGTILAIGSPAYNVDRGQTRVYKIDIYGNITNTSNTPAVADVYGNIVVIRSVGQATLTATQAAAGNYPSATANATLFVTGPPTLGTFNVPSIKYIGDPNFNLDPPSSNSDGSFSYSSNNVNVATVSGRSVAIVGAGSCTITATQDPSGNYTSAFKNADMEVRLLDPNLGTFDVPTKIFGDVDFQLTPPTSSNTGGSFSYISLNKEVADVSGNMVTIKKAGECTIRVTQAAYGNYASAFKDATLYVALIAPTFGAFTISDVSYGSADFQLTPPTSSNTGGSFSYISLNPNIADVSGNMVTIKKSGECTIRVTQAAYGNYASKSTTAKFTVVGPPDFGAFIIPNVTLGDLDFQLTPPTSSNTGGSFTYISLNPDVADVSGNMVTIKKVGECTIRVTQAAVDFYTSASVSATFWVRTQPDLGSFNLPSGIELYDNQTITKVLTPPSSNSSGAFTFTSSNTAVATITVDNGVSSINIIDAGSTTIKAIQAAWEIYNTASSVPASLTVAHSPFYQINSNNFLNTFYSSGSGNSTTLFTNMSYSTYNINMPNSNFSFRGTSYSTLYLSTSGLLFFGPLEYQSDQYTPGVWTQYPTNTFRFFSGDNKKSTCSYAFNYNNTLLTVQFTGYIEYKPSKTFDIRMIITQTGQIKINYNIGDGFNSDPIIIGYVGNDSSATTDDIFLHLNGTVFNRTSYLNLYSLLNGISIMYSP